jgi:hypothetical protein
MVACSVLPAGGKVGIKQPAPDFALLCRAIGPDQQTVVGNTNQQ